MPPPSYQHRHLLLSALLEKQPAPPPDAYEVPGQASNERGCKLDSLLLQNWASSRRSRQQDNDVLQNAESLRLKKNDFEVLGRLGEGQFGVVDAVRCKLNGTVYAMKTVEKSMAVRAGSQLGLGFERHVHVLAGTGVSPAPAIAASFQSPNTLHLVTSYAACGSLWDRLCEMPRAPGVETGRMGDTEVQWWARQMVAAISWLHGLGYAHRDIKPHNFLLHADGRLWVTDFGSVAPLTKGKVPKRYCLLPAGTPDYVAPEILRLAEDAMVEAVQSAEDDDDEDGDRTVRQTDVDAELGYGPEVDWWSLGATLHEMATGAAPFWAPSIGGTYERIMRCDLHLPEDMSPQLKSLLSGLLSLPDVRLEPAEIRRHSFFHGVDWTKKGVPPPGVAPQPIDLSTLAESFIHDFDDGPEITFDHFFNSTTISSVVSGSHSLSVIVPQSTWSRWVGWSWDPPTDFFGSNLPAVPPGVASPAHPARQTSAPPALNVFTPLRRGHLLTPPTAPRTAPRSVPRTRPVSERQAFAELMQCVEASAKKKIAARRPAPGSASSTASSVASTHALWRKEQPPTPTPMSREVTTLNATMISKGAGGAPVPRPLSRTSSRASLHSRQGSMHSRQGSRGDDTFLAKLTAIDAEKTSRTSVSVSHTRSFSREDTMLARLIQEQKQEQDADADATPRASRHAPAATTVPAKEPGAPLARPSKQGPIEPARDMLSRLRAEAPQRKYPDRTKPLSLDVDRAKVSESARLTSREAGNSANVARVSDKSSSGDKENVWREQEEAQVKLAKPPGTQRDYHKLREQYRAPRDPGVVGDGSRLASLEIWHKSLEAGLTNLEQRLADLTSRLNLE